MRHALIALLLVASLALPPFLDGFLVFQLTLALISILAVLGLNILMGYTGQISLGHGAFYALGAYLTAICMQQLGVPYWAAIPISGVACFIAGFLFGFPALRLAGHYLALATFVLAVCMPQLLKWHRLESLTGGVQGILLDKPQPPSFIPLSQDHWLYYVTLFIAFLMFYAAFRIVHGRTGRALTAVRDHPTAAAVMGVNISLVKTTAFGISAVYAGIAGSLSAILVQFVSPDSFNIFLSISLLVGVVVGGVGTIAGSVFGGVFIQFVPNLADQLSKSATWALYGALLLIVGLCMRGGIEGLRQDMLRRFRGWITAADGKSAHVDGTGNRQGR